MMAAEVLSAPTSWPGKTYGVAELLAAEFAPPRWAIPNLAVRGEVSILYGASGSGKSTLYHEAVVAHAMGRKFLGLFEYEEPQRFAVFDWENSPPQVVRSMRRLGLAEGAGEVVQLLSLPPASGIGLDTQEGRTQIESAVGKFRATCLIFDHRELAFEDTDELDGQKVTRAMAETKAMAQRLDAAIVIVAHEPKAQHVGAMGKLRGHTAWAGLSDQVFHYQRHRATNTLDHEKARGLTKRPALDVLFLEEGEPNLGPVRIEARLKASSPNSRDVDVALVEEMLANEPMSWGELARMTGWGNARLSRVLKDSPRIVQPMGKRSLYCLRAH